MQFSVYCLFLPLDCKLCAGRDLVVPVRIRNLSPRSMPGPQICSLDGYKAHEQWGMRHHGTRLQASCGPWPKYFQLFSHFISVTAGKTVPGRFAKSPRVLLHGSPFPTGSCEVLRGEGWEERVTQGFIAVRGVTQR